MIMCQKAPRKRPSRNWSPAGSHPRQVGTAGRRAAQPRSAPLSPAQGPVARSAAAQGPVRPARAAPGWSGPLSPAGRSAPLGAARHRPGAGPGPGAPRPGNRGTAGAACSSQAPGAPGRRPSAGHSPVYRGGSGLRGSFVHPAPPNSPGSPDHPENARQKGRNGLAGSGHAVRQCVRASDYLPRPSKSRGRPKRQRHYDHGNGACWLPRASGSPSPPPDRAGWSFTRSVGSRGALPGPDPGRSGPLISQMASASTRLPPSIPRDQAP